MKLEEMCFSKALREYVDEMTSPLPYCMQYIQHDTKTMTPLPQMVPGKVVSQLLHLLVKISNAKRCLEVGTFTGSSALQIASALPTDGTLTTLDIKKNYTDIAQRYFDKSPHGHKINIILGNALETLDTLTGPYDFAFIDADKANYPQYYEKVVPKLAIGGILVIDDVLWRQKILNPNTCQSRNIYQLNNLVKNDKRIEQVMLTIRDGLFICRKKEH